MRPALILFAKAPVPGQVKTRLRLPAGHAVELHRCFVRDTLDLLAGLSPQADIQLFTDTPTDAWSGLGVARFLQAPGGLGERMRHAITSALAYGRPQVAIVGSDSPDLPRSHLEGLLASRADVALGPCEDGGYYAICCRKQHPDMFAGVEFSSCSTLRQTLRALRACGLSVELGETWYDVDSPEDLKRLALSPQLPRHTALCLGGLGIPG